MKRTFLFLLTCLFINISYSQTYNFEFSISDFSIIENNDKHVINHPTGFDIVNNTCDPMLPSCVKNILLPPNKKVSNYSVTYTATNWQTNIDLEAMPVMHPTDGSDYSDVPCSYDLRVYPDSIVRYGGLTTIDRYDYVTFVITPFIYDAANRSLSFVNKVNITIELMDSETNNGIPTQNRVIKRIVHNPDDVDLYYPENSQRTSTQNIDYLIITADNLKNSFNPLRIWKTQKGVYTKIVTLNEIYSNYEGATPQLKIKRCIQDYYNNHGLKWVLLGGDDAIVPIIKVLRPTNNENSTIPADMLYGCFDGPYDWNGNGNELIGEWINDSIGFNQVVNISRLPIRTSQHVKTYINKLLNYERSPMITNPSMLLCAQKLWNYDSITNYSDAHLKTNIFLNQYITPNWNGNITRFYDTYSDFSEGANYNLNVTNLTEQLNKDYNFLHFAAHGKPNNWELESGFFNTNDVTNLTNSYPMVISTISCFTNQFDSIEPCLSEALIRKPMGGAIAYFGSSRSAWESESSTELGSAFNFSGKFFSNLFSGVSLHFAEIVKLIKLHFKSYISNNTPNRFMIYSSNAIGDAELPIFTTIPNKFYNIIVERNETNITISTCNIDSCTITISNIANGGEYYFTNTNVSSATFNNVPNNYTIVITKENYIPCIIKKDCHIFNEIITHHQIIEGCQHTQIGGMVEFEESAIHSTNNIPILSEYNFNDTPMLNGKLKITSTGSLEVKNRGIVTIEDLSMEKGSELYIH